MPSSRGNSKPDPDKLAAWEARAYSVNRAHAATAAATVVDELLPEDPQNHIAATRSALRQLPPG